MNPTKTLVTVTTNDTNIVLEARTANGRRMEVIQKSENSAAQVGALVLEFTQPKANPATSEPSLPSSS